MGAAHLGTGIVTIRNSPLRQQMIILSVLLLRLVSRVAGRQLTVCTVVLRHGIGDDPIICYDGGRLKVVLLGY